MLNLDPTKTEEKDRYNDDIVRLLIEDFPDVFRKKHSFPLQQTANINDENQPSFLDSTTDAEEKDDGTAQHSNKQQDQQH